MKLWKRTSSEQQVGGRPSACWPRVSTNPNGAEDARSLRLAWKNNSNGNHNNNNNNNNISNGVGRCQEKCWADVSRRSLQHLPGILRASPEPSRGDRTSPEFSAGRQGFASLPYYLPNNISNHHQSANHYKSGNHYNHRSNSNFSSLPVKAGFHMIKVFFKQLFLNFSVCMCVCMCLTSSAVFVLRQLIFAYHPKSFQFDEIMPKLRLKDSIPNMASLFMIKSKSTMIQE